MRIIQVVLFRWKYVISRATLINILLLNRVIPMNFRENEYINILQTKSCDNLANLFTKSLPYSRFHKCVEEIDMRRLKDL
jgi:hypothetical protein